MIIEYSPVVGLYPSRKTTYTFGFDKILVKINNADYHNEKVLIDLTNIEEGKQYEPNDIVKEVRRNSKGSLEVKLLNYTGGDASEDEKFPEPFSPNSKELEIPEDVIFMEELEEIVPEVPDSSPSTEDRMEALEATMLEMLGGL